MVEIGEKNVFYRKEDGSVLDNDLSEEGLDEKVILRADGIFLL